MKKYFCLLLIAVLLTAILTPVAVFASDGGEEAQETVAVTNQEADKEPSPGSNGESEKTQGEQPHAAAGDVGGVEMNDNSADKGGAADENASKQEPAEEQSKAPDGESGEVQGDQSPTDIPAGTNSTGGEDSSKTVADGGDTADGNTSNDVVPVEAISNEDASNGDIGEAEPRDIDDTGAVDEEPVDGEPVDEYTPAVHDGMILLMDTVGEGQPNVKDVYIDNTVDNSVSYVIGRLVVTDADTGEVTTTEVYSNSAAVTYSNPRTARVQGMIDAAYTKAYNEAKALADDVTMETSEETGRVWDNRVYTTVEDGDAVLIGDTDYLGGAYGVDMDYTRTHIASGDYGKETFYTITAKVTRTEPETVKYNVIVVEPEGGTVTVSAETAAAGETVAVTAKANAGWVLDSAYAGKIGSGEQILAVIYGDSGYTEDSYTFNMPAEDVQVIVDFKQQPTATSEPTATPEPTVAPDPTATPEPTATPKPTATPAPTKKAATKQYKLVYTPVAANTHVNGAKASDNLTMAAAVHIIGASLDSESAIVDVVNKEKLMNAAEIARFDALSVEERLTVALNALGFSDALEEPLASLSDDARALLEDIDTRIRNSDDAARQAWQRGIDGNFLPRLIVVDGEEHESIGIELKITRGGSKSYERYTFFYDGGEWKLFQIEKGVYVVVD